VGRPEGRRRTTAFDRLVLAAGSVNKLLPIPGVAEYAHGFRGISEALYLRDHITRQLELAAETADADERDARCTFVVVGAGYTGTEVAAQGQLFTARLARQLPGLRDQRMRWLLADRSERLLPGLSDRMSRTAERVLRRRGLEIRLRESIDHAGPDSLRMTTGEEISTRSLIWCVGVRADPLVAALSLPTDRGGSRCTRRSWFRAMSGVVQRRIPTTVNDVARHLCAMSRDTCSRQDSNLRHTA
jgi:NADH dehydrogenase